MTDTKQDRAGWLAGILESLPVGISAVDREWRIRFMNARAFSIVGRPPSELIGRVVWEAFPELLGTEVERVYRDAMERGIPSSFDVAWPDERTQFSCHVTPTDDGYFVYFEEITERKRVEQALRNSEARFRMLVEQSPLSTQIFAPDGRTLQVNRAWEELWGLTLDKVADYNVLHDPQLAAKGILSFIERGFAGEATNVPAIMYNPNETIPDRTEHGDPERWVSAVIYPVRDEAGAITEVVLVHEDITERKRAEEALQYQLDLMSAITTNTAEGLLLIDAGGRLTFMNPAAERTLGWTFEKLRGEVVHDRVHYKRQDGSPYPLSECPLNGVLLTGERLVDFEDAWVRHDGSFVTVQCTCSPIVERGRIVGAALSVHDIAERKRAERELRRSRDEMAVILQGVADGISVQDPSGAIVYANDAAARIVGFSTAEEMLATRSREILSQFAICDEEGYPFPLEDLPGRRALREGRSFERTVRFRRGGSGEERWSVVRATPVLNEQGEAVLAVSIFREITEQKRAEEAQRFFSESSALLAASLEYEPTLRTVARLAVPQLADWCAVDMLADDGSVRRLAVAHIDPEKIAWAHELERKYPPNPDAPMGVPNVLRTGKSEFYPEIPEELLVAGAKDEEHMEIIRQIGFTSAMIVPMTARGRTLGAITFVSAESGHHYKHEDLAMAEELARRAGLAVDNARLYREAREASRLKDEFLATISHELRTPLNAMLGWARMLRSGRLDATVAERALEAIERNARAQAQLVEDILDVSRVITGKLRIEARPVDLAAVATEAVGTVLPAASAKGIEIATDFDAPVGAVTGDSDRLRQVVWNLLSNAIKFTPSGGRIEVAIARREGMAEISVRDTGSGIPPEFLPHVFDRFSQADGTITRKHGGLGLGLAIVRHIVEMHGGTVAAESEGAGHGATFLVRLPLALEPKAAPALAPEGGREPREVLECPPELHGVEVLIVDDDPDALDVARFVLEQCGCEVKTALSAAEGLGAVERRAPDVIVSDLAMPGEDGFSFIRRVRKLPAERGGRTPAIALSAQVRPEDRRRALEAGFDAFAAKPLEPDELAGAVASVLRS